MKAKKYWILVALMGPILLWPNVMANEKAVLKDTPELGTTDKKKELTKDALEEAERLYDLEMGYKYFSKLKKAKESKATQVILLKILDGLGSKNTAREQAKDDMQRIKKISEQTAVFDDQKDLAAVQEIFNRISRDSGGSVTAQMVTPEGKADLVKAMSNGDVDINDLVIALAVGEGLEGLFSKERNEEYEQLLELLDTSIAKDAKIIQRLRFVEVVLSAKDDMRPKRFVSSFAKDVLTGLKGVIVVVEQLPAEVERQGLTSEALQTDTELRLRQFGIKVDEEYEQLLEKHFREDIKQRVEYFKRKKDLAQSKKHDEFLSHVKGADKLVLVAMMAESDERFWDCVKDYLTHTEEPVGSALLCINLSVLIEERGIAVGVSVELQESVILERDRSVSCGGVATWRRGSVLTCGLDSLDFVQNKVRDYVDEFINDYLAANPKK